MIKTIVAILLLAAVANAQLVGWRNCGSSLATVHRVRISGCSATPCVLTAGTTVTIEVDATASAHSNNLPFAMTASVLNVPIPGNLLDGNACNHFTLGSCPALSGNSFTFRLEYFVGDRIPPGVNAVIHTNVFTDFGDVGVCVQVDVRIGQ